MTPDEMLQSLRDWKKACENQRTFGRAKKLQRYIDTVESLMNPGKSWRDRAKELDIPMFQRKKEDVIADIEAAEAKAIKPAVEGADLDG